MTCDDFEAFAQPFVDGEFAEAERAEVARHLAGCGSCSSGIEMERAFRRKLRDARETSLAMNPAPSRLRDAIRADLRREAIPSGRRVPIAVAASLAIAAAGAALYVQRGRPQRETAPLLASAVAHHQRDLPLEVRAPELPAIQSWFRGKVDFSPSRIPSLRKVNLVGARLSNITDRQAAYVTYGTPNGQRRVSLFVFDAPDLTLPGARRVNDRDVVIANQKGYNVAIWKDREIAYSLVSDLDEQDILELVAASGR
jgi:anti-sigma factor RsiW